MEQNKNGAKVKSFILRNNTYLILLVLFIVCSLVSKDFLTLNNLVNICQQYTGTIVVSIGMLFVILTGGIDLSVGSIVAIGSVLTAYGLKTWEIGIVPSCLITLLVCSLGTQKGIQRRGRMGEVSGGNDDDGTRYCLYDFQRCTDYDTK